MSQDKREKFYSYEYITKTSDGRQSPRTWGVWGDILYEELPHVWYLKNALGFSHGFLFKYTTIRKTDVLQ